ncbi:NADP oxidoreductase [bacterium F11]|nr:NADP oxidoreductase [bacterium F11]
MSSKNITFTIDGTKVQGKPGQTVMEAADEAGINIPRLCYLKGLSPHGSCRVCVVKANGRVQTSCTQPISEGMVIENNVDDINSLRRDLVDMLFVEGNHICPSCEKSGNCELQGVAYRLGIAAPKYPYQFPRRDIDASHSDIFLDLNRCILCARCVQASRDLDGKTVFEFVERGPQKKVAINAKARLADTNLDIRDKVVEVCPVGSILKKHVGFAVPVGQRTLDKNPADITNK